MFGFLGEGLLIAGISWLVHNVLSIFERLFR